MLGKILEDRRRGQQRMGWLDGITDSIDEFEQGLWVGNGQGSLACYSPWDCKELDMTEWLNWTVVLSGFFLVIPRHVLQFVAQVKLLGITNSIWCQWRTKSKVKDMLVIQVPEGRISWSSVWVALIRNLSMAEKSAFYYTKYRRHSCSSNQTKEIKLEIFRSGHSLCWGFNNP